ncbi:hypothetical protein SAMN05444392_11314 [Seinonella peptonophila]|uniref:Uncharacterized protein n=1 Tax=Seinonella peptonophila TaxID=112248 RepID=A0A1M5ABG1_9BACL|nr:hypothetical protein SAMN05444392_11314 [Seinonella peptonophila]
MMIKVIILVEKKRYIIPLPFFVLHITGSIICSKWFWRQVNKRVEKNITFPTPLLDKQTLQPVLSSLKECKGIAIVDVKDKDGNGVMIRF